MGETIIENEEQSCEFTSATADRVVAEAGRMYFAECRARIPAFTDRNFSLGGSLRLHRHAVGWDILRAPANVALSVPQVGLKIGAAAARAAGWTRVGEAMGSRNLFLRTAVARELRWRILTDLLRQPFADGERVSTRDALAEAILGRPEVKALIATAAETAAARQEDPAFRARLDAALVEYAGTRAAAAEITTGLIALGTGAVAFHQATPGMIALGPALAASLAQSAAIASFPLGAGAGGIWYGLFPAQASPLLVSGSVAGLFGIAALTATFAGVISDPVQRQLGLHQRRLTALIGAIEKDFHNESTEGYVAYDIYVARLLDLSDVLLGVTRAFRG